MRLRFAAEPAEMLSTIQYCEVGHGRSLYHVEGTADGSVSKKCTGG